MSKITFGKEIDMNLLNSPKGDAITIAYHSGGGGFPKSSLLQKNSAGQISYVGGSGAVGATGPSGGILYINKTKLEVDALISNNSLIPGTLYKISGVHPTLYDDGTTSGTTIYLTALTTNTLSKDGHGEFWNPKYDKSVSGFGIWSNRSSWSATITSGVFNLNEELNGGNGIYGKLFGILDTNLFTVTVGDWSGVTSITGFSSNATATVTNISLKTYSIGDKTIWGGYSWTNNSGLVGSSVGEHGLDYNWTIDSYDLINYKKVLDVIVYDYTNDWIVTRHEVETDNIITFTFIDNNWTGDSSSAITSFMFGNGFDENTWLGIGSNKGENSLFQCVNFQGSYIYANILTNNSRFQYNTFIDDSYLYSNTLSNGSYIASNKIINSQIQHNSLLNSNVSNSIIYYSDFNDNVIDNSVIQSNIIQGVLSKNNFSNSSIQSNKIKGVLSENNLTSSSINNNNLMDITSSIVKNLLTYSSINYNTLSDGSSNIEKNSVTSDSSIDNNNLSTSNISRNNITMSSTIQDNTQSSSNIEKNTLLSESRILSNILDSCNIYANSLYNLSSIDNTHLITSNIGNNTIKDSTISLGINTLTGKNILNNDILSVTIVENISLANILFLTHPKTIYRRPDGVTKIRYFNEFDTLVIADITD